MVPGAFDEGPSSIVGQAEVRHEDVILTPAGVGKIEWGVDDSADEKLSLYEPDASLNIGTAVLADWTIPALDQGSFNRIALMGKDTPSLDEIRVGATSADVMPGAGPPCNVTFCETDPENQGTVSLSTCDCSGGGRSPSI